MTDQEILEDIRNGNTSKSLDLLYEHFPTIRSMIIQRGGSEEDALDIFQDALVLFVEKARDESFELTSAIKTYLFSVCKFKLYDKNRSKKEISFGETPYDLEDSVKEDLAEHQKKEARFAILRKVMHELGERCTNILQRYYYLRESMSEIAVALGYANVNTAKTQKYKCMERARKMALAMQDNPIEWNETRTRTHTRNR